jgi:hypothetical protein
MRSVAKFRVAIAGDIFITNYNKTINVNDGTLFAFLKSD